MTRKYVLDQTLQNVLSNMKLRKPQVDSIRKFHNVMINLPRRLSELDQSQINTVFKEYFPEWDLSSGYPEITCALATGVGKTRLMGAFMAYLHRSEESSNFLLLAPRTTIIEKLIRETRVHDPKYIFVDPSFISQPIVYHSDNFEIFDYKQVRLSSTPNIWILSPQAIARTDRETLRFHRPTEFLGMSLYRYLENLEDLVVFFDESHHLGEEQAGGVPVWTQGVRSLSPRLLFAMTASPRSSANILHEYGLPVCLRDGLYTKGVQVVVKQRPESMDDLEWDKVTLRFALSRLTVKENALKKHANSVGISGISNPIILVCAKDINHAETISEWLKTQIGDEAVLLVHSGMPESRYINSLLDVEKPGKKVRAIVNVFKLTEGWDVTNVFVVAPLRALATVTGVLQTMGRGLRLPFGKRVEDPEIDSLDVLCFGRETMNEIVDRVLEAGYGDKRRQLSFIDIIADEDVPTEDSSKIYRMKCIKEKKIKLPKMDLVFPDIDFSLLKIPMKEIKNALAIDISDPDTIRKLEGKTGFNHEIFVSLVTSLILRKKKIIGSLTNRKDLENAVENYLMEGEIDPEDIVRIEPELAAYQFIEAIDKILSDCEAEYVRINGEEVVNIKSIDIQVPYAFSEEIQNTRVNFRTWKNAYRGWPIRGWNKCSFYAVPFDNSTELHVAKILDRAEKVEWWFRNLRNIFKLHTPVGTYSPDFLFLMQMNDMNILLEVKGEHLASGPDSESVIKAMAANSWCKAINEVSNNQWDYWMVIDKDVRKCQTIEDLKEIAEEWKELMLS